MTKSFRKIDVYVTRAERTFRMVLDRWGSEFKRSMLGGEAECHDRIG